MDKRYLIGFYVMRIEAQYSVQSRIGLPILSEGKTYSINNILKHDD